MRVLPSVVIAVDVNLIKFLLVRACDFKFVTASSELICAAVGEVVASGLEVIDDVIIALRWCFYGFNRPLEVIVNDIDGEGFAEAVEG